MDYSQECGKIVFVADDAGARTLMITHFDGITEELLSDFGDIRYPQWSMDGTKIIFMSNYGGGTYKVYVFEPNSGNSPMALVNGIYPVLSGDGTKIAYCNNDDGFKLYIANADGSNPAKVTDFDPGHFSWSPDKSKFVFTSNGTGVNGTYVMNQDGSGLKKISSYVTKDPAWSPDGQKIAFGSDNGIYVMSADGSGAKQVFAGGSVVRGPHWSSDGKMIVFGLTSEGTSADIWIVNADGSNPKNITNTLASEESPALWGTIFSTVVNGTGSVNGGTGNDLLNGGAGNDTLNGGAGADMMIGSTGDDIYVVDNAGDVVSENADGGRDWVKAAVSYTLGSNVEDLTLTGSASVNAIGNSLDNVLTGNTGNNVLNGDTGDDVLIGGVGNDTLIGGSGNDSLNGGAGTDTYVFAKGFGKDVILRDSYNSLDTVVFGSGIADARGSELLCRREGNDLIMSATYADGTTYDELTLQGWYESAANKITKFNVNGKSFVMNDYIQGTEGADAGLKGGTYNDKIDGLGGDDTIYGGAGDDSISGGEGSNTLDGGLGNDELLIDVVGDSVGEHNWLYGGAGNDRLTVWGNDENILDGGADNDTLTSYGVNSVLYGGAGNDTYVVAAGIIKNAVGDTSGIDKVQIVKKDGAPANINDYTYELVNNNLVMTSTTDTTVTITFADWMNHPVATVQFDGQALSWQEFTIQALHANWQVAGNAGNNTLTGNAGVVDVIYGYAGNDVLDGGAGVDALIGGIGNDTYLVDGADAVYEEAGGGVDTVRTSGSYRLAANVENLELTGVGDISGSGNELNNIITGNGGNNWLDGLRGADKMSGGMGNDTYIVDDAKDIVVEKEYEGIDTVISSISYKLGETLENLTLSWNFGNPNIDGTGNAKDNVLTGNSGNNTLWGYGGNDLLDGGSGIDKLYGGIGDDIYIVDNAADVVIELANAGVDTVRASVSYTLGDNVENLELTGSGDIDGTGNALDNTMTGNSGKNTLLGGGGNDTYIIDNATDVVSELANAGLDTVRASVSYILGENVENLVLTGFGAIEGTGNALDNKITGNADNNTLWGEAGNDVLDGGYGNDKMYGGSGNDTYVVDSSADVVIELSDAGLDTVHASISYTLGDNVENLELTGVYDIGGTGNALDNTITGNMSDNILSGGAGNDVLNGGMGNDILEGDTGNDILDGGMGDDIFRFGADFGHDIINDSVFNGGDTIRFESFASTDIAISYANEDLILTAKDGSSVTVENWCNSTENSRIHQFQFADGEKAIYGTSWEKPFNIEFDYTYAGAFFTDEVKNVLDYAAGLWERVILNDFEDVASGTQLYIVNPNTGVGEEITSSQPIDDLRIYVGTRDLEKIGALASGGPSTNNTLDDRWSSQTDFEPCVGSIAFDDTPSYSGGETAQWFIDSTPETANDVASAGAGKLDFLTTAVHEIGHVLGIVGGVNAWDKYIKNENGAIWFTGTNAKAQNGGQNIIMLDSSHPNGYAADMSGSTTPFYNNQAPVMSYGLYTDGGRLVPTAIELGMLQDIGYDITYESRYQL
ncbi:calcium-binding protein [Anaeromusa acidaminophila]|uniref:calcium-binding protein n=1 Tax=Anaeromusa acidaminophila TaxID=81464 RepID=UPI0003730F41|nr:calcium-binding protein [Anaeromusa acidaminophila]